MQLHCGYCPIVWQTTSTGFIGGDHTVPNDFGDSDNRSLSARMGSESATCVTTIKIYVEQLQISFYWKMRANDPACTRNAVDAFQLPAGHLRLFKLASCLQSLQFCQDHPEVLFMLWGPLCPSAEGDAAHARTCSHDATMGCQPSSVSET